MFKKEYKSVYIVTSFLTVFFIFIYFLDFFVNFQFFTFQLEMKWFDTKFADILKPSLKDADKRIIIAGIDEKTIKKYGWPFPRKYYADLIENLVSYGVKVIAFDVFFADPDRSNPQSDAIFARAVERYADKVILGVPIEKLEIVKPFELLYKSAVNFGAISASPLLDYDGNIRKIYPFIPYLILNDVGKEFRYSDICHKCSADMSKVGLPLLGTMAYIKYTSSDMKAEFRKWRDKRFYINFRKPLTIQNPDSLTIMYRSISVADIIEKTLDEDVKKLLKGASVFVGSVSQGAYDHYSTPINPHTPGVEIHAVCMDNLLNNDYLRDVPMYIEVLVLVFFIWLPVIFLRKSVGRIVALNFIPILVLMFLSILLIRYNINQLFISFFFPNIVSFIYVIAYKSIVEDKQKRWIKNTFSQYLSPEVVDILVKDPSKLKLGGERRDLTVLFMDIAGFTSMSEKMPPENVINVLNFYLSSLSDIILEERGVIDKYIGDCIMAFWNAPVDVERHRLRAVRTALRCLDEIKKLNLKQQSSAVMVRIGINSGYAVVGNMGSKRRFSYTVLGDMVNLASRLEGANKFFGTSVMVSQDTVNGCDDEVVFKYIGKVSVVGKTESVDVYEPFKLKQQMNDGDYEFMKNFENGIKYFYEKNYNMAAEFFEKALSIIPSDRLCLFYRNFSIELREGRAEFNGIFNIRSK